MELHPRYSNNNRVKNIYVLYIWYYVRYTNWRGTERYVYYAKASWCVGIFVNSSSNNSLHNPHYSKSETVTDRWYIYFIEKYEGIYNIIIICKAFTSPALKYHWKYHSKWMVIMVSFGWFMSLTCCHRKYIRYYVIYVYIQRIYATLCRTDLS